MILAVRRFQGLGRARCCKFRFLGVASAPCGGTFLSCQWRGNCCTRRVVSSKRPRKQKRIRWFLASVFAALWLFTGFAATSSELHHCLHEDAPSSEHQCLFTKYAEGQFVDAPIARITLQIPRCLSAVCPPPAVVELPSLIRLLPPERAPPIL